MSLLRQLQEERRRAKETGRRGQQMQQGLQQGLQQLDAMQRQIQDDALRRKGETQRQDIAGQRADEAAAAAMREAKKFEDLHPYNVENKRIINQRETDYLDRQRGMIEAQNLANAYNRANNPLRLQGSMFDLRLKKVPMLRAELGFAGEGVAGKELGQSLFRDVPPTMAESFEQYLERANKAGFGGDMISNILGTANWNAEGAEMGARMTEDQAYNAAKKAFDAWKVDQMNTQAGLLGLQGKQADIDKKNRPPVTGPWEPRGQKTIGGGDRIPRGASFKAASVVGKGKAVFGVGPVGVSVDEVGRHLGWGVPKGPRGEVKISPQQKEFAKNEKVLIAADKALRSLDKGVDTGRFKAWLNGVFMSVGMDPPELSGAIADMARTADLALREASGAAAPYQEQLKVAKFTGNQAQDEDTARRLMLGTREHYRKTLGAMRRDAAENFILSPSSVDHYGRDYTDPVGLVKRFKLLHGEARETATAAIKELGGIGKIESLPRDRRRDLSTLLLRLWANQ